MPRPSRRTVLVVSGVLGAALVAGGTVAVVSADRPDRIRALPGEAAPETPDGSPSVTPSASPTASPTASPSPTTAPTSTAPAASATTTSSGSGTGSGSGSGGDQVGMAFGPRAPGSVTFPYRAGQTSWTGTSNGINAHITMSAGARAGSPMTWRVTTSAKAGKCCDVHILYGDGLDDGNIGCGESGPTLERQHVYNKGGRHHFMVQVGNCTSGSGVFYGSFDVGDGPSTAQGPSLPVVKFDSTVRPKGHENDLRYVSLWGEAEDRDGYLRKLVVTFGDGTSKTFPGWGMPCEENRDGWPIPTYAQLPYDPPHVHKYAKPGTYTLTLTAYSTGCDGTQTQAGTKSFTWTVPAPETPSPSATPTDPA